MKRHTPHPIIPEAHPHHMASWFAHLKLGPSLDAGRDARVWAAPVLSEHGCAAVADDALVVLTELVVNGARHGLGILDVELSALDSHAVRIAVGDSGTGLVARREPDQAGGRGLHIVAAIAERWGVDREEHGKVVWAVLRAS